MRLLSTVACLVIAAVCLPVNAQVHRCTDATGKIIYSDAPCAQNQTGKMIEPQKSREQILEERQQAAEAKQRKYQAQTLEHNSQVAEPPRQSAAQHTKSEPQNLALSRECREAKKELEFVSSIRTLSEREERLRTNAAITNVNASCGTHTELIQEPPNVIVQPNYPSNITHCDTSFCYDNQGGVYHKAGPDVITGPNGRTCHRAGDTWNCN